MYMYWYMNACKQTLCLLPSNQLCTVKMYGHIHYLETDIVLIADIVIINECKIPIVYEQHQIPAGYKSVRLQSITLLCSSCLAGWDF